jgi:SAM-dependent methyltransferase
MRDFDYTGRGTLENLEGARNYNGHIFRLIAGYCDRQSRVLDFGAGRGTYARKIGPLVEHMVAVEPDKILRDEIQKISGVSALAELPNGAEGFDLVYLINVLEHIKRDDECLDQLARVLKPGGRLFVYVPASPALFSEFDVAVGHYRRYTARSLRELASGTKLELEKLDFTDPLGWVVALVHKFLRLDPRITRWQVWLFDRAVFPVSRYLGHFTGGLFGKNILMILKKPGI